MNEKTTKRIPLGFFEQCALCFVYALIFSLHWGIITVMVVFVSPFGWFDWAWTDGTLGALKAGGWAALGVMQGAVPILFLFFMLLCCIVNFWRICREEH
ncbi:MAG: hypothetical protein AAB421_02755 [Patescibacteria group bacterium]